jgi:hypothetical protein
MACSEQLRLEVAWIIDMSASNSWVDFSVTLRRTRPAGCFANFANCSASLPLLQI